MMHSFINAGSVYIGDCMQNIARIINVKYDRFCLHSNSHDKSLIDPTADQFSSLDRYALVIGLAIMPASTVNNSHKITRKDYFNHVFRAVYNERRTCQCNSLKGENLSEDEITENKRYNRYIYYILIALLARYMYEETSVGNNNNAHKKHIEYIDNVAIETELKIPKSFVKKKRNTHCPCKIETELKIPKSFVSAKDNVKKICERIKNLNTTDGNTNAIDFACFSLEEVFKNIRDSQPLASTEMIEGINQE